VPVEMVKFRLKLLLKQINNFCCVSRSPLIIGCYIIVDSQISFI